MDNQDQAGNVGNYKQETESEMCNLIGGLVMLISVIAGIAFILAFGKVPRSYYGEEWSVIMILTGIGIGLQGVFFGYLLQKIGSILRYHESK